MPRGWNLYGIFLLTLTALLIPAAFAAAEEGVVNFTVPVGAYNLEDTPEGQIPWVEGYGRNLVPGIPNLPARIFSIAIPPGARITEITYQVTGETILPGTYQVPPVPLPRVAGNSDARVRDRIQPDYDANMSAVYGSDNPFPAEPGEFLIQSGYRKYNMADVRISPFSYYPLSGKLLFRPQIEVGVHYEFPPEIPDYVVTQDFLPRTEQRAQRIVANYAQAQSWYGKGPAKSFKSLYDFVIITLNPLVSAVQPLVDWETEKGRSVKVVTTSWISGHYSGYDLAARVRGFLIDKYASSEWGIRDVLLVGHYDDLPMRRCAQDIGYGQPETDFYYAELSKPDYDSWDMDNDLSWGEDNDPNDFYGEVNTGRIPWSDPATVNKICKKSVAYEKNTDPAFKKNMLLLGAFFWVDTDCATLMELKTDGNTLPWMNEWTTTRMYEKNSQYQSVYACDYELTPANAMAQWTKGKYAYVNWGGHGSPWSCHLAGHDTAYFVQSIDSTALNDDYPSVIFADACSNSDTDETNIGQEMLRQGAVGFMGATKVALGTVGWSHPMHGCSSSADYFFTTNFTKGDFSQGEALQEMLQTMYVNSLFAYTKYGFFEWSSLWGSPGLSLETRGAFTFCGLEGKPERYIKPGMDTKLTLRVESGLEDYLPGSGKLHYRFHSGDLFTRKDLMPLAGNGLKVVLPAPAPGAEPEFFFSAKGTGGSTVFFPAGAPNQCFTCDVAFEKIVVNEEFEGAVGWTTEDQNVDNGEWEKGDPGASPAQPGDDHSAEGFSCFVTGKAGGSMGYDDLDGGPTRLLSPDLDMGDGEYDVSFYYWVHQSYYNQLQPFEVHVSNDSGAGWTKVMDTLHAPGWNKLTFRVSDYVAPTATVKVRFTANDNPNDGVVEALVDDFMVTRVEAQPSLWAEGYTLPVSTGRPVDFHLNAGAAMMGEPYQFLGSYSGTLPGTQIPGGPLLPLNWDHFTDVIVGNPGSPYFQDFKGTLDGSGQAVTCLNIFRPLDPSLVGLTLSFAYLVGDPPLHASDPVAVQVVP